MHSHHLARLRPISRERLFRRHLDEGVPLKVLAAQAGDNLHSAYKSLGRCREGDVAAPNLKSLPHRQYPQGFPLHQLSGDERPRGGPVQPETILSGKPLGSWPIQTWK
jgi:hypothetical protein